MVLRGVNGFTLLHAASDTDLNFIGTELKRLGANSAIKLYKWANDRDKLEIQILEYLAAINVSIDQIKLFILPVTNLHFGILQVNADGETIPNIEITRILLQHDRSNSSIDFGPEDLQMRSYKQQIRAYLNPVQDNAPCIIYQDNKWHKGFELSKKDLKLLNYLLPVADNREKLKNRITQMLACTQPEYQKRFATMWFLCKLGYEQFNQSYFVQFLMLIMNAKKYSERIGFGYEPLVDAARSIDKAAKERKPNLSFW